MAIEILLKDVDLQQRNNRTLYDLQIWYLDHRFLETDYRLTQTEIIEYYLYGVHGDRDE